MKKSVCHYSLHRTWDAEKWDCHKLCDEIRELGAEAVDFHVRYLGDPSTAASTIAGALNNSGLTLSGLSMSNDFNKDSNEDLRKQIDGVKVWMPVAAEIKSPVSRIFGGHIGDRSNPDQLQAAFDRMMPAFEEVLKEAEKHGVVLALENHGGLPCTGEEQVEVIEKFNSPHLKATIDVGNYMQGGQEGHDGTRAAAKYAAYVHFKDFKKTDKKGRYGWGLEACTVGQGDVQHRQCLELMKEAGYEGFVALEYEGKDDERKGVRESLAFMNEVMKGL